MEDIIAMFSDEELFRQRDVILIEIDDRRKRLLSDLAAGSTMPKDKLLDIVDSQRSSYSLPLADYALATLMLNAEMARLASEGKARFVSLLRPESTTEEYDILFEVKN